MLASMVKLKAGRLAREVTDSCLQYYGGMGFTNEVHELNFTSFYTLPHL
jgi:citronellyl-CoA dehydrogenase